MANQTKISAVIVDTEESTSLKLQDLLKTYGDIDLIGTTAHLNFGLDLAYKFKPDILFIDGEILEENGNLLLSELSLRNPFTHIVVTCSGKKRASQIFGNIVPDYLISPVDQSKLHTTIERIKDDIRIVELQAQVNKLSRERRDRRDEKVMLTTKTGYIFVNPRKIVFCQADSNYTAITTLNNKQILVSKSLRHFYEESLPFSQFIRISRSVVINKNYLTEIIKSERKCILEVDGCTHSFIASPDYYKLLKKNGFSRDDLINESMPSHNTMPSHNNMLSLVNANN